nr:MAG TPA: hypothetical protein [Caudoviricetes sp.]
MIKSSSNFYHSFPFYHEIFQKVQSIIDSYKADILILLIDSFFFNIEAYYEKLSFLFYVQ